MENNSRNCWWYGSLGLPACARGAQRLSITRPGGRDPRVQKVSRMTEQALSNRRVREEGASAVEAAQERIATLERQVLEVGDASSLHSPAESLR